MFKGKYWTRNFTLVVVHKNPDATEGDREIMYIGHWVIQSTEFNTRNKGSVIFYWNVNGECVRMSGLVDDVSKYDLMNLVNPQSVEGGAIVRDCDRCIEESKG